MAYTEIGNSELKKLVKIGDSVEGYYIGQHKAMTKYGETVFIDFIGEDGNEFSIVQTQGMRANWEKLLNVKIKIEYIGDKTNDKTGRKFKDYKIYADFDDMYLPFE